MIGYFKKNLITVIAVILAGFLIGGAIIYVNRQPKPQILSAQEVGDKAVKYINEQIFKGENKASLVKFSEEKELYKITLKIEDQESSFYTTRDGKFLFPNFIDLDKKEEEPGETPKTEKPDVKLFVMSYCPYGLQMQKVFLPVYNLLKDKTEMGVYFVNYIMHEKKEIDENLRQYCIQKEENDKYVSYLSCFVNDGNFEGCLSEAAIDNTKLSNCVSATDAQYNITASYNDKSTWLNEKFPKFDVQADLNQAYGVGGSPTVVINGKIVEISPRSPEKFKEIICTAFTSPPQECSQTLSNDIPSAGLGGGTGSSNGGSCQ